MCIEIEIFSNELIKNRTVGKIWLENQQHYMPT